jgi:hypothetical protein
MDDCSYGRAPQSVSYAMGEEEEDAPEIFGNIGLTVLYT